MTLPVSSLVKEHCMRFYYQMVTNGNLKVGTDDHSLEGCFETFFILKEYDFIERELREVDLLVMNFYPRNSFCFRNHI